jgi:cystathionine gamma-synthase
MTDLAAIEAAIRPETKLIWVETPANPLLTLSDIEAICKIAHARNILVGVDNTLTSPILQNPIQFGADIVMHATTKYIGGHSDVLGGAVVFKAASGWSERVKRVQILMGATQNPLDCYLLARGLKTAGIEQVHYPGLSSNPNYALAIKQMPQGQSGMIAIQLKGDEAHARKVANRLQLFQQATSLGGVESLVEHRRSIEGPGSTTPGNLLRLSIGLEHVEDLWEDLNQAILGA